MTTSKAAAQVAHALVTWVLQQPASSQIRWSAHPGLHLTLGDLDLIPASRGITICDNGLTEVEPGTATVRAGSSVVAGQ